MLKPYTQTLEMAKRSELESSRFHSLLEAFERQIDMLKTLVKYEIGVSITIWNELIKKQEEIRQCLS